MLIGAETKLFALRLSLSPRSTTIDTLRRLGVSYEALSLDGIQGLSSEDHDWLHALYKSEETFHRVPFQHAMTLARRRRALLRAGYCLVPSCEMVYVAAHHYERSLRLQMQALYRSLHTIDDDERSRLAPVLARIVAAWQTGVMHHSSNSGSAGRLQFRLYDIDRYAELHFPLCMKHLHHKLRENHHLKYNGRVQYRMFLKGLGVSVGESLVFFRSEFVKVMPTATFEKEHAYHIRHSYGLEGSRKDYEPLACAQIIHGSTPRHGQYHGCPFRHWDEATLCRELSRCGLDPSTVSRVAGEVGQGRSQSACRMLFDATHHVSYAQAAQQSQGTGVAVQGGGGVVVQHPNAYVEVSERAESAN